MRDSGKRPDGKGNRDSKGKSNGSSRPFDAFRKDKPKAKPGRSERRNSAERPESKEAVRKSYVGKGKKKPVQDPESNPLPRLNQYIAKAGICSRREADDLILEGKIKVNKKVVREMGYRVQYDDQVEYQGKVLLGEEIRYILLNKPKDFICTMQDEKGRKTVIDLIKRACKERVYPVGRLDRDTTGLLLFTNDGDLAKKLTDPKGKIKKIYHVFLDKPMTEGDMAKLAAGVKLEDGLAKPEVVNYVMDAPDGSQVGIQLNSAKNGIVAKMFEHLGYEVKRLDRVLFANLTKKDIPRGKWRILKDKEVTMLKVIAGKSASKKS